MTARRTSTAPPSPKAQDGRERIIVAAERLIAERGIDVPLRDIAVAADQRNNSAVQYHFGSRDGDVAQRDVDAPLGDQALGRGDDALATVGCLRHRG